MTSSLFGGTTLANRSPVAATSRRLVITNAARGAEGGKVMVVNCDTKKESNNGRRDLVFAAAAAAVCSVAGIAVAVEPKRGTSEARKTYAPVCVTMPTARICRKWGGSVVCCGFLINLVLVKWWCNLCMIVILFWEILCSIALIVQI